MDCSTNMPWQGLVSQRRNIVCIRPTNHGLRPAQELLRVCRIDEHESLPRGGIRCTALMNRPHLARASCSRKTLVSSSMIDKVGFNGAGTQVG